MVLGNKPFQMVKFGFENGAMAKGIAEASGP